MEQPEDPTQPKPRTPSAAPEPIPAPAGPVAPDSPVTHDDPGTRDAAIVPVTPDDLAAVRELILLAHPDIVPELVHGATIAELQAAVAPARAAYRQVAERIAGGSPAAPPTVPAGAAGALPLTDGLPPAELIKRALQRRA